MLTTVVSTLGALRGTTNGAGDCSIDDTNDQVIACSSVGVTAWALGTSKEVLVDNLGGGDFLDIMSAVADWTVTEGTATNGYVGPYRVYVANGPYDEIYDFSDANLGVGDIKGDIIIQSVTPGTRIHIRPQSVGGDGIRIHQSYYDVTFIDMLISPSVLGSVVTDDIVKIDENVANDVFNTISFYNCIVTDSDASGNALITSRAEAYTPSAVVRNANRTNSFPSLLQVWGDGGEALNFYAEDCVFYGNHGQGNSLRLACDGQDGETCTLNNCVLAYAEGFHIRLPDTL